MHFGFRKHNYEHRFEMTWHQVLSAGGLYLMEGHFKSVMQAKVMLLSLKRYRDNINQKDDFGGLIIIGGGPFKIGNILKNHVITIILRLFSCI